MIRYVNSSGEVLGPLVVISNTLVDSTSEAAAEWRVANGFTVLQSIEELPKADDIDNMTLGERTAVLKNLVKVIKG